MGFLSTRMTSAHSQYNYNRRNSTSATPYTIPIKHQHQHHHHHSHSKSHHNSYHNSYGNGNGYHGAQGHNSNYQGHTPTYQSPPYQDQFQSQQFQYQPHQKYALGHNYPEYGSQRRRHSQASESRPFFKSEFGPGEDVEYEDDEVEGTMMSSSVPTLSREFVVRRISEGESGRLKQELKCEACGKGYKHISSLAKHLWEHTPEWNVTKKLLISKHQQVQLLEAASILVGMNEIPEGSRRNSVFQEEDCSNNNTPEPYNSASPLFKITEPSTGQNYQCQRSNSISQYPPTTETSSSIPKTEPGVQYLTGGYLDNGTGTIKEHERVTTIGAEHQPSYSNSENDPESADSPQGSNTSSMTSRLGSRSNSISHGKFNSASHITPKKSNDSFNDEIIGKME